MAAPRAEHYSSIPRAANFTGGRTIRDWLTGQTFEDQYRFGKGIADRLQKGLPAAAGGLGIAATVTDEVEAFREEYRRWVIRWEATRAVSVWKANGIANKSQAFALGLVASAAGRNAIESLLREPSVAVRLAAAVETLRWDPGAGSDVLKDVSRRDKSIYGLEAEVVLREMKAGRLNLDWRPTQVDQRDRLGQPGPTDTQLDAVVAMHSATMSGGFFYSLVAMGPLFPVAIAGYEGIGLGAAAGLLRQALAALPWDRMPADHDERADLINRLPDDVGQRLEAFASEYHDLFPRDSILFDAIEAGSQ